MVLLQATYSWEQGYAETSLVLFKFSKAQAAVGLVVACVGTGRAAADEEESGAVGGHGIDWSGGAVGLNRPQCLDLDQLFESDARMAQQSEIQTIEPNRPATYSPPQRGDAYGNIIRIHGGTENERTTETHYIFVATFAFTGFPGHVQKTPGPTRTGLLHNVAPATFHH